MTSLAQAQNEPAWLVPVIISTGLVLVLGVFVGVLLFVNWYVRRGEQELAACLADLPAREQPEAGDVRVEFPVYFGLLGKGVERTYRLWLSPAEVPIVLGRLHRFNCRWGWLMLGPLAPVLSFSSLRRALRQLPPTSVTHAA